MTNETERRPRVVTAKVGNLRRDAAAIVKPTVVALLGVTAIVSSPALAQVSGNLCACTPRVYQLTFDLSQNCGNTGGFGQGVILPDCSIIPFDDPTTTDLVPTEVTLVDIIELGQNLQTPVGNFRQSGNFTTGDTIMYTSFTNNSDELDDMNTPKALQLSMIGANANGDSLVFQGLLAFSNSCDDYPVLLEGAANGWVNLVS